MKPIHDNQFSIFYLFSKIDSILDFSFFTTKLISHTNLVVCNIIYLFSEFIWYIFSSINLSIKIEKGVDFFVDMIYLQFQLLNKKKFNTFWSLYIEQENYYIEAKKMIKITEKFLFHKLKFKIPIIFNKENFEFFFCIENFRKNDKIELLYYTIKKKRITYIKHPFNLSISHFCFFWSEIWYKIEYNNYNSIPWWRYFNVRESELEYYDQIITFLYSFTGLKF